MEQCAPGSGLSPKLPLILRTAGESQEPMRVGAGVTSGITAGIAASITVDKAHPTPAYLQLQDKLRSAILEGDIAPGEALPSERDLADALGTFADDGAARPRAARRAKTR